MKSSDRFGYPMVAWRYTSDFNKQYHLFYDIVKTDYVIETFICSCGDIRFIIKYPFQQIKHICPICKNKTFYDANRAWQDIEQFLYQNKDLDIEYSYDIYTTQNKMVARCFIYLPKKIDFLQGKVIFDKKAIHSVSLSNSGVLKEHYSLEYDSKIFAVLRKNLKKYFIKNKQSFYIPMPINKKAELNAIAFFLQNKHLKDYELIYWRNIKQFDNLDNVTLKTAFSIILNNRKEKSLKKAIYTNFLNQVDYDESFNDALIKIFINKIDDINILVRLLKLDIYNNDFIYDYADIGAFIDFLKKHYSENQILNLFRRCNETTLKDMFNDMIYGFSYCKSILNKQFKKVKCDIQTLHDEFIRISFEKRHKDIHKQKLFFDTDQKKACVELDKYQIKLPKSGKELIFWANELHNCMASYFEKIQTKQSLIYGFFTNNKLKFAVEISNNTLIQASAKYNRYLTGDEERILNLWLIRFFQKVDI